MRLTMKWKEYNDNDPHLRAGGFWMMIGIFVSVTFDAALLHKSRYRRQSSHYFSLVNILIKHNQINKSIRAISNIKCTI